MKKYRYKDHDYSSIYQLRRNNPSLVFAESEEAYALVGIEVIEQDDPVEVKLKRIEAAIDAHIQAVMKARTYDSITSCITYLGSSNSRWNSDAQDALAWRTAVWEKAYDLLNRWQMGEISELTPEEVVEQLPEIEWTAGA